MARMIENLENAFNEMFDFITDLPSGLDGFESDFDSAFKELDELKSTLTQPNVNAVPVVRCKDCKHAFGRSGRKPFACYLHGKMESRCMMVMIFVVMENERKQCKCYY